MANFLQKKKKTCVKAFAGNEFLKKKIKEKKKWGQESTSQAKSSREDVLRLNRFKIMTLFFWDYFLTIFFFLIYFLKYFLYFLHEKFEKREKSGATN